MSIHNLCFGAKKRKYVYPSKPHYFYVKVGCKGVLIKRTCFRDGLDLTTNLYMLCVPPLASQWYELHCIPYKVRKNESDLLPLTLSPCNFTGKLVTCILETCLGTMRLVHK